MTASVVSIGTAAAMTATALAALAGLAGASRAWRRASLALLGGGAAVGLAASVTCLASGLAPLPVFDLPLLASTPFVVDRLSAFFLAQLHGVAIVASWFASRYLEEERHVYPPRLVLPLTSAFVLGMQGVVLSAGLTGFLLFWEAMSLASFFLVMADRQPPSRRAALLYLAVAQLGFGALLVGLALLSGGALLDTAFDTLAAGVVPGGSASLGAGLVLFACGSKAGLAPLHAWLPEAHPRAPSHVSALMSGVMLEVAVYGLLRVMAVWPEGFGVPEGIAMLVFGLGGAVVAVISATLDRDIKRILAWSSVENLGLTFAMLGFAVLLRSRGLAVLGEAVLAAMFLHLLAHALFKSGLFLGAGTILHAVHTGRIEQLGGLARRMPVFSAGMLALALAAAGLPPFGSFAAEWLLLQSVVASLGAPSGVVLVGGVALLVGLAFVAGLAVFAMVRLFAFAFLAEARSEAARHAGEPPSALCGPVLVLAAAVLLLGPLSPWLVPLLPSSAFPPSAPTALGVEQVAVSFGVLPLALAAAIAAALAAVVLLRRVLAPAPRLRRYHTWDCGQPIDETMEYTATAFSAPIRHFVRDIVRAEKHLVFRPVAPSNPWIRRGEMELRKAGGALERFYLPAAAWIEWTGARFRRLQNGVIQFYIALILATLLLTLWMAL